MIPSVSWTSSVTIRALPANSLSTGTGEPCYGGGITGTSAPAAAPTPSAAQDTRTLDDFKQAFTNAGITLTNLDTPLYAIIGATDGIMFYNGTSVVKIYEYDSAAALDQAESTYATTIKDWPTNGKFLLETSDQASIDVFNSVK